MRVFKSRPQHLPPVASVRQLFTASVQDYLAHWPVYVMIVGIVIIPSNLIGLNDQLSADQTISAYKGFGAIFMSAALIWAMANVSKKHPLLAVRAAYYDGSAAVLRLILVSLALAVLLIPAGVGIILAGVVSSATDIAVTFWEQAALWSAVSLLVLPSIWLMVRFVHSIYAVIADGMTPITALSFSRRLTLGRFWRLLGKMLIFGIVLSVLAIIVAIPFAVVGLFFHSVFVTLVYDILVSLLALPLANSFFLKLYYELKEHVPA